MSRKVQTGVERSCPRVEARSQREPMRREIAAYAKVIPVVNAVWAKQGNACFEGWPAALLSRAGRVRRKRRRRRRLQRPWSIAHIHERCLQTNAAGAAKSYILRDAKLRIPGPQAARPGKC